MIIDYHSHLKWDREADCYGVEACLKDMADNHIEKRMVSALAGYSSREQNDSVADMVKKYPSQVIGCAVINPKDRDCVKEMERVVSMGCFRAIELNSMEHCYYPETMPVLDTVMDIAASYGVVVNVFTGWGCRTMPAQWAYYAKRHRDMLMVLLHMGTTDFGYGCVDLVQQYDNLMVETSCMYELPILRKAFRSLPKEKFLFGSHYPDKITKCSIDTFELLHLPQETVDSLYYKNAAKVLSIKGGCCG